METILAAPLGAIAYAAEATPEAQTRGLGGGGRYAN